MQTMMIGQRPCTVELCPDPEYLLIQPVDEHDAGLLPAELALLRSAGRSFTLVAVPIADWNAELSPWPAAPVFGKTPFGGGAGETLRFLETEIMPRFPHEKAVLGGYSLAALFALWAGYQTDAFHSIAAASPSVWFDGWEDFAQSHPMLARRVYLSLGDREDRSKNPRLRAVSAAIRSQDALLEAAGLAHILEWNPGNHFVDSERRTARAFLWCMQSGAVCSSPSP